MLLLPGESMWPRALRAVLYLVALLYIFAGINVVADRFMSAIERITTRRHYRSVMDPETGVKGFVVKVRGAVSWLKDGGCVGLLCGQYLANAHVSPCLS